MAFAQQIEQVLAGNAWFCEYLTHSRVQPGGTTYRTRRELQRVPLSRCHEPLQQRIPEQEQLWFRSQSSSAALRAIPDLRTQHSGDTHSWQGSPYDETLSQEYVQPFSATTMAAGTCRTHLPRAWYLSRSLSRGEAMVTGCVLLRAAHKSRPFAIVLSDQRQSSLN